jgi:putative redox protein
LYAARRALKTILQGCTRYTLPFQFDGLNGRVADMVQIDISYEGGLRCTASHLPSGTTLSTDAPVDNQGKGESFSPTDLVATALGTCMATTMDIHARRNDIDLTGMRITVKKGMTTTPPRRIAELTTEIWLPLPLSADPERHLERVALACPVHASLRDEVAKPLTVHYQSQG